MMEIIFDRENTRFVMLFYQHQAIGMGYVLFCFYLIIKLNALHEKLFKGLSLLDKRRLVSIS